LNFDETRRSFGPRLLHACDRALSDYIDSMLPDEATSPEQIEIFRRMTPEQRWEAARALYWTMRQHKTAFLQSQHPEWTEAQVADAVRENFSHART